MKLQDILARRLDRMEELGEEASKCTSKTLLDFYSKVYVLNRIEFLRDLYKLKDEHLASSLYSRFRELTARYDDLLYKYFEENLKKSEKKDKEIL